MLMPAVHSALSSLDDELIKVLQRGDIKLVRSAWILSLPANGRILRRQELEALVQAGESPSPLLSPDEAVELVRAGRRCIGVLTYGWLSPSSPDPAGKRLKVVRSALEQLVHIVAIFWECVCLFFPASAPCFRM